MFRSFLAVAMIFSLVKSGMAQVGIGTSGTVNASAKLQVDATDRGFLPPRVSLQGTNDAQLTGGSSPRIASPATGLLVYNTATAGSGSTAVTPGLYYYDGVRWQRVINTMDATVTFDGTDPATATTFTDGPAASASYIYVSDMDNSQWTWNGTAYVTYNPPASTAWMTAGGTTDAGSNKSGKIYRTGNVGIGTNNPQAALDVSSTTQGMLVPRMTTVQRSAIVSPATSTLVYDTNLGEYYYYTGTQWDALVPKPSQKIFQVFSKAANQTISTFPGDVTWSSVSGQGTALSYSSASITLPANKTFLITGYLALNQGSTAMWATYRLVNAANATTDFVVSTRGYIEGSTELYNDSNGGPATAMINTGSTTKQIKLQIIAVQGSNTIVTTSNADAYAETILIVQEL